MKENPSVYSVIIKETSKQLKHQADALEKLLQTSEEYTTVNDIWDEFCGIWDKIDEIADALENISCDMK